MKLSDLVLPESSGSGDNLNRRTLTTKSTPLSARSAWSDGQENAARSRTSSGLFSNRSSFSTPRPEPSLATFRRDRYAQTPPFSPNGEPHSPTYAKDVLHAVPPKALPTPPPQSAQDFRPAAPREVEDRPVSHILHVPNDPVPMPPPLSPRRVSTQQPSLMDSPVEQDTEFVREAVQRHQRFIEKEVAAASESEALRLFADFIISESSIRRERYANALNSNSLDIEEVRQRLFEPPHRRSSVSEDSQNASSGLRRRPSEGQTAIEIPQSRSESAWWNSYQPCLSPIASLSISNDEMSSRGRAPSRWWESKSSSEGVESRVQRSKRESKYMGLNRELREAMQWGNGPALPEADEESHSTSQPVAYGPNEYPPEKVGWHEQPSETPPQPNNASRGGLYPSAETHKMDISRLITLPPPYPRHYPAVNNNHPDLVSYRTTVRSISDLSEIKSTRMRHKLQVEKMRQDHQQKIQDGRRQFRANIQSQIEQGSITFAEAAEAEAALALEEKRLEKELVQAEFDSYQEIVLRPMHAILTDRINRATACIDELSGKLFDAAQHETPDQAQEEGDEKPELLEKLTQLKWLFEAREQLHLEIYDLLSERNEKYRALVSLPYRQSKNEEKICETDAFFITDALDRRVKYETDTVDRLECFMVVIEENVARGVEMHLSAFWDIAPSLLDLLQKIPEDLRGFEIQIPANEYEENPSYRRHPLQYLYSLLLHAEKSTYQYIESQTNLLCLLHEVKSAVTAANCKLEEAQRIRLGEPEDVVRREMQERRAKEERDLTADLKDRVATVEEQWTEALGSTIQGIRERVKEWLIAEGGWDELEQLEIA